MSALQGNRGVGAARECLTRGSSGGEEKGDNKERGNNRGEEAGGSRQRAEGGYKNKRRSAGWRVMQVLLLLILCTAGSADSGGSWGMFAAARDEGRSLEHSREGGCWGAGSWQQAQVQGLEAAGNRLEV